MSSIALLLTFISIDYKIVLHFIVWLTLDKILNLYVTLGICIDIYVLRMEFWKDEPFDFIVDWYTIVFWCCILCWLQIWSWKIIDKIILMVIYRAIWRHYSACLSVRAESWIRCTISLWLFMRSDSHLPPLGALDFHAKRLLPHFPPV